jgi:hypothetical protein
MMMGLLDGLWNVMLPGQGSHSVSGCRELVPVATGREVITRSGGGIEAPSKRHDTGTGYDGGDGQYARVKPAQEIDPVINTKGPLRWANYGGGEVRGFDGNGRAMYYITKENGRFRLLYHPAGSRYDDHHLHIGSGYASADAARSVAEADHRGRSGGKGY